MAKRKIKIALGADHAGYSIKTQLRSLLKKMGYTIVDVGTSSDKSVDYPDYAQKVGKLVVRGKADKGILACGSGIGMTIAANKVKGVRAALAWDTKIAALASQHNWSNILCISARFIPMNRNKAIIKTWLKTPNDPDARHRRRIKKIRKMESKK